MLYLMPTDQEIPAGLQAMMPAPREQAAPVVKVTPFSPRPDQIDFQEMAIRMSETHGFLRDWMIEAREKGSAISMQTWQEWENEPGFIEWFYDFPLPRTMTSQDIEGLDPVFWAAIRSRMAEGDAAAMKLYAQITGKLVNNEENDSAMPQVKLWLESAGGVSWQRPRKLLVDHEET
jgi:hypothetical protein